MELDYTICGQQAVLNVTEQKIDQRNPQKNKKTSGTVVEFVVFFSCSEECVSSFRACEHFSQHHIWLLEEWREGGGE